MDTYAVWTYQLMNHSQMYSMPMRTPTVHQYMERFWMASMSFRESALNVAKAGRRNANHALYERVSTRDKSKENGTGGGVYTSQDERLERLLSSYLPRGLDFGQRSCVLPAWSIVNGKGSYDARHTLIKRVTCIIGRLVRDEFQHCEVGTSGEDDE